MEGKAGEESQRGVRRTRGATKADPVGIGV